MALRETLTRSGKKAAIAEQKTEEAQEQSQQDSSASASSELLSMHAHAERLRRKKAHDLGMHDSSPWQELERVEIADEMNLSRDTDWAELVREKSARVRQECLRKFDLGPDASWQDITICYVDELHRSYSGTREEDS